MCDLLESHERERYYQRNRQVPSQAYDRGGPGNNNPTIHNDRNNPGRNFNNPPRFQNQPIPRQDGGGNNVNRGNYNNHRPGGYQRDTHYQRGNNYYRPYQNQPPNHQPRQGNGNQNNNHFRRVHYTHASRGGNRRNYYQGRRSFPNQHSHSSNSDRDERESGYRSNGSDSSGGNRTVTQTTEVYHNGHGPGSQEPIASTSQDRHENGDLNLNTNRQ